MQGTVQKLVPTDAENRTSLLAELIQAAGIATEGGPESAGNDWLFSVCSLSSVHSFSMPLSSMRLMVWCPWLCPHVVCQAPQHLNSFDWLHILPSAIPYFSQRLLFCSTIYLLFMVAVFFSCLFFCLRVQKMSIFLWLEWNSELTNLPLGTLPGCWPITARAARLVASTVLGSSN